jgi:hypothetical protein
MTRSTVDCFKSRKDDSVHVCMYVRMCVCVQLPNPFSSILSAPRMLVLSSVGGPAVDTDIPHTRIHIRRNLYPSSSICLHV